VSVGVVSVVVVVVVVVSVEGVVSTGTVVTTGDSVVIVSVVVMDAVLSTEPVTLVPLVPETPVDPVVRTAMLGVVSTIASLVSVESTDEVKPPDGSLFDASIVLATVVPLTVVLLVEIDVSAVVPAEASVVVSSLVLAQPHRATQRTAGAMSEVLCSDFMPSSRFLFVVSPARPPGPRESFLRLSAVATRVPK
jgi:hypothetical protein